MSATNKGCRLSSDINFEIMLADAPEKSRKAALQCYDAHNLDARLGSLKTRLKKGTTKYGFKKCSAEEMEPEHTDMVFVILDKSRIAG